MKFVMNEAAVSKFMSWIYLQTSFKKRYHSRTVNSIYLDDLNYSSVRDNLSGVSERHKTRLRWYKDETTNELSTPVLEKKTRLGRLGSKSSVSIPKIHKNLYNSTFFELINEIKNEISFDNYASLEYLIPTLSVSYNRKYYEDCRGVRITLDDNIKFKSCYSIHHKLAMGRQVDYKSKIVEVKFNPNMKNYVVDLIRPLSLTPVRHSKYITGLAMFGQVQYL